MSWRRRYTVAASVLLFSWIALRLLLGFWLLSCLRNDTTLAFKAESLAKYGNGDISDAPLPASVALEPLSTLIEADSAMCAYTRHILASCYGLVGDDKIDALETALSERLGHTYYECWKAEEIIGRAEAKAEYDYGLDLNERPLSDLSYIDSVKNPDTDFARFAAIRAVAGAEIGNLYIKAEEEWDKGRKKEDIFLTLVVFSWFLTMFPALLMIFRIQRNLKLKKRIFTDMDFSCLKRRDYYVDV